MLTGPPPYARHRAPGLLSEISEGKRGGNEQPGANQQGERDTAEDREDVVAATSGLGAGSASLRRQKTHPEVTHASAMRKLSKHPKSSETRIAIVRTRAYEFEWDARPSA